MSQRKDGMCCTCKTAPAHANDAYCKPCRERKRDAWLERSKASGKMCVACIDKPALEHNSYCRLCKNDVQRNWYHNNRARKLGLPVTRMRAKDPNACNCGNSRCNGMSC